MKLTADQKALLQTEFPAELQKEAEEQVKLASSLYSMGFEKMASEAADALDESEKEDEDEDKEKDGHKKKACDEEMEKEASDRAAFIARGYVDGLMKEGTDRHGDELHYLYPFIGEKLAMSGAEIKAMLGRAGDSVKALGAKAKGHAEKGVEHVKSYHKGIASDAKKVTDKSLSAKERAIGGGKAALKSLPHAAVIGGGAELLRRKMKKNEE